MKIPETFKSWTPTGRFALLAALAVAISALLVGTAASASAETTGGVPTAPPTAAESPAPVEQTETLTDSLPDAAAPAPVPVETQEVTSAADSAGTTIGDPGASAPNGLPVSTPPSGSPVPSPTAIADSVATAPTEFDAVAGRDPGAVGVPISKRQISGLTESVTRESIKKIESIRQGSAQVSAPVTKLLPAVALPVLELSELPDFVTPAGRIGTLLEATGPSLETAGLRSVEGALNFFETQRAGLLSHRDAIARGLSMKEYLVKPGSIETVGFGVSDRSHDRPMTLSPAMGDNATVASATVDRFGGPAPSDIPLPTPESPAGTVSGSGGSFFVPLAALLALLALVAPAIRRRLREVADFSAPTPFVCALERPG